MLRSLEKGLVVEVDIAVGGGDKGRDLQEAMDESERPAKRTRTERWESEFGLTATEDNGVGEETIGSSWHEAMQRVSLVIQQAHCLIWY